MKKTGIILLAIGGGIILVAVMILILGSLSSPADSESFIEFEPIVFTGSGSMTTSPFAVTTQEWIVDWLYIPDSKYPQDADFNFLIYPRGETARYIASVWSADITGSTYSYEGPGEYYIKVLAYNIESWEIVIKST